MAEPTLQARCERLLAPDLDRVLEVVTMDELVALIDLWAGHADLWPRVCAVVQQERAYQRAARIHDERMVPLPPNETLLTEWRAQGYMTPDDIAALRRARHDEPIEEE